MLSKKTLQLLYLSFIAISLFLFFFFDLNKYLSIEHINQAKTYILKLGIVFPILLVPIYIVLNITTIPRVFFTVFLGYVYNVFLGFFVAWFVTVIGLGVTFIFIRYLFKNSFEKRFGNKRLIERINKRLNKNGIWLVIFLRASYFIPSSLLNYSFGFTKIKTLDYFIGSAIGFIPVVLLNVWFGSELANQLNHGFNYEIIFIGLFLLLIFFAISRLLKQKESFLSKS